MLVRDSPAPAWASPILRSIQTSVELPLTSVPPCVRVHTCHGSDPHPWAGGPGRYFHSTHLAGKSSPGPTPRRSSTFRPLGQSSHSERSDLRCTLNAGLLSETNTGHQAEFEPLPHMDVRLEWEAISGCVSSHLHVGLEKSFQSLSGISLMELCR